MKWFDGPIIDAITTSRSKKLLFVVVVLHRSSIRDEKSEKMLQLWNVVDETNYEGELIGIRIYDGSDAAHQFAQIYPVPVIPASYLIDLHGKPLEIITVTDELNDVNFMTRLRFALDSIRSENKLGSKSASEIVHKNSENSETTSKLPTELVNPEQENGNNIAKNPESNSNNIKNMGDSELNSVARKRIEANSNTSICAARIEDEISRSAVSLNEQIEKARQLIEEKRLKNEETRKLEEKEKELERRKVGKLMTEAKNTREEKELQELMEKRRKEKRENEEYLRKLREQIKADREECNGGLSITRKNQKNESLQKNKCSIQMQNSGTECRIQCKFSDGSTLIHHFPSSSLFSELIDFIEQDGRVSSDFQLIQIYPRREFPDSSKSFLELGLTPSATIMVIEKRISRAVLLSGNSFFRRFINLAFISPFQAFCRIILHFFGYNNNSRLNLQAPETSTTKNEDANRRNHQLRDGNVHRFRNRQDSNQNSDEEARWNGNSTQQL